MLRIYSIRDTVAGALVGPLHLMRHDAPAVRMFGDVAASKENMVGQHPADFELVRLGNIDEDTQTIDAEPTPVVVLTGKAWLAMQNMDAPSASLSLHSPDGAQ